MAKEVFPKLTEAQVRKLATPQSLERGQRYFKDGAIVEPLLQGNELRAECAGSDYKPYELSVAFEKKGVLEMDCTCPYDQGGACKHLVALLLTCIHKPQAIRRLDSLDKMLAERSKEELIAIIKQMVKRDAKLLQVIELAAAAPKPGKPMNVTVYRNQARRAMNSESPRMIERELKSLRETAARLAKAGDWLSAGAIYHAALDEAVSAYDEMVQEMDDDGDICIVMDNLAEGLAKCLAQNQADSKTRWSWIETMLEAELRDVELGGIDLAPAAGEAVLKLANDEEWAQVEKRLRAEAQRGGEWKRETLIGFLTEGLEKRKRTEDADELIRELGTPEQQAYLLISEGKIAEAMKMVKTIIAGKPGLVTRFADALLTADAKQEALALVMGHDSNHWQNRDWLAKYYRKHGTTQEAVEAQRKAFLASPTIVTFKSLREVSRKAGNWEQVRADALAELERKEQIGELIEIALDEKDVARALELLSRVKISGWNSSDYKWEVAQAAEKEHPQAAIALYQELAERSIGNRTRGAYQQAADYLKRARKLVAKLDGEEQWKGYLQDLRVRHPTLRALHEELSKARL
jgi:uncharacterized Zn finger protein